MTHLVVGWRHIGRTCIKHGQIQAHTCFFGASLFGWFAWFSCSDAVSCQNSKLVLHPWTQLKDWGRQFLPLWQFRNWKRHKHRTLLSKPCKICRWQQVMLARCYLQFEKGICHTSLIPFLSCKLNCHSHNKAYRWWPLAIQEKRGFWPGWCSWELDCGCLSRVSKTEWLLSLSSQSLGSPEVAQEDLTGYTDMIH